MTLILYVRCKDGCILISDRKASEASGHGQEDRKTFLSQAKDFVIGGAGTGFNIVQIFATLSRDNTLNGSNAADRIHQLLDSHADEFSGGNVVIDALLVARENGRLVPYDIKIRADKFYVNPASVRYRSLGMSAARILADYFLKRRKLDEVPWLEALHYAVAVMKEVAEEVDSVGRLEVFGFDVTVMLDDGSVYEWPRFEENRADLHFELRVLKKIEPKEPETTSDGGN
jgi:hypothetical protein